MISLDVNHPDVMDFIKVKRDGISVTGANISIRLNNEFMKAVENDEDYILRFPCDKPISKDFFTPKQYGELMTDGNGFYWKLIKAKEYWDEIIKSARDYAEPGLMYWDNALDYDPAGVYEQYKPISSNPCGEQFLQANDSCRLIVHNLVSYVKNPFTDKAEFDFDLFYKNAYECLRLGDDLVDLEAEYIQRIIDKIKADPEQEEVKRQELELWKKSKDICLKGRRVGIGITALGDTLASLEFKYDSDEALEVIEKIMFKKMEAELDCTVDLAILRGTFEGWDKNMESDESDEGCFGNNNFYEFILKNFNDQFFRMKRYGRRNVSFSTIAPTGSVSLLAGNCTSGCEPLFQPFYMRRKKINPGEKGVRVDFVDGLGDSWQEFPVLHPKFKDWLYSRHKSLSIPKLGIISSELINPEEWSKDILQNAFEASPWYGSTANDINWGRRVEIQAILQKYTTNAISSTINLPKDVSEEEVSNIYMEAWKQGLKGITVNLYAA